MAPTPYSGQIDLPALCPLGLGGRAEPQECSGLGAKSLTNTERQLCSLLRLGESDQSSTAEDLDEATEVVWLSSQE